MTPIRNKIRQWRSMNGGFIGQPSEHALRLLHEAVELCLASGARPEEVRHRVEWEINKAFIRGPSPLDNIWDEARQELADVAIYTIVMDEALGGGLESDMEKKVAVLFTRDWVADADGVLWRPGRRP